MFEKVIDIIYKIMGGNTNWNHAKREKGGGEEKRTPTPKPQISERLDELGRHINLQEGEERRKLIDRINKIWVVFKEEKNIIQK